MEFDLESYYHSELPEREALLEAVRTGIQDLLYLFEAVDFSQNANGKAWRYWVGEETDLGPQDFSQSTTSMIAAAILGAHGNPKARFAHGYRWHRASRLLDGPTSKLSGRVKAAKRLLRKEWTGRKGSNSSTYGLNDILTISWYLDLFFADGDAKKIVDLLTEKVISRCKTILEPDDVAEASRALNDGFKSGERVSGSTLYILLRFVRCERALPEGRSETERTDRRRFRKKAYERFQSGLRDQLSFAEVVDSRFDPCELAFCLEGMLHLRPDSIDDAAASRVFDVIHSFQDRAPGWRPQTPLTTSHRGEVLYAIGVETATSILCSLSILDVRAPRRRSTALGHKHLRLILRYWDWLKSRRLTISLPSKNDVTGWRSERLGGPYLHIWENSQILEFLVIFEDYLRQHIAGELLELSELDVRLPQKQTPWPEIVERFEPTVGGSAPKVYREIGEAFVEPRLTGGNDLLWSMLLFGPPGTGKTVAARNLAEALRVPLIRVTVSDFLTAGDEKMERRAKLIFEVLRRQMLSVVLFDELDQFLLDRDSALFRSQSSAFQLLTPGMLTKIADLRAAENVIFVLATNYEDRIDNAIKRAGRVDVSYLFLQPNLERRKRIIRHELGQRGLSLSTKDLVLAARNAVFLNYNDLVRVAKHATLAGLAEAYNREPRDIQFSALAERSEALIAAGKPLFELGGLARMAIECVEVGAKSQPRFVERLGKLLKELQDKGGKQLQSEAKLPKAKYSALIKS